MQPPFGKLIAALVAVFAFTSVYPVLAADPAEAEIRYGTEALPEPVQRMWEAIHETATAGNIDEMLPVLESNELPPLISREPVKSAISHWRAISGDGEGREILAAMIDALESGYVRVKQPSGPPVYVWPYFAEVPLNKLTPMQEVELYRLITPDQAKAMRKKGRYTNYRIGIGSDGTWHYFLRED